MQLEIEKIRRDGGTQPRSQLLIEVTEDYVEQMRAGVDFPAVTVFFDGNEYWLADGFHRVEAWSQARPGEPIEAEVIQGTQSDAQWYSFGVNKSHGLRRSNEDKIRSVRAALEHRNSRGLSDRAIAEHIGVSHPTVAKYRTEINRRATGKVFQSSGQVGEAGQVSECIDLAKTDKSTRRKGRDGRTINTARIGKVSSKRTKRAEVKISPNATPPKLGHSLPNPMIPLQFSPNNSYTAAATLVREFTREWVEQLIQDLHQLLSEEGVA